MVRCFLERMLALPVFFLAMSCAVLPGNGVSASDGADPLVKVTAFGAVQGVEDAGNTWSWRGVPYAKPPVGELRWRAPRDPMPWNGVLKCHSFRYFCAQYGNYISETGRESMGELIGKGVRVGSEDCLYLNIWRPRSREHNLPVYVFIHGGANAIGRSDLSLYNGAKFASKENMVFVSVNYRLGQLGWFSHPSLRTGNPLDDSGNYGLLDIMKALSWVHANISSFGGDPANVTVCGQSAGAVNVCALLVSPLSQVLFNQAIIMSGPPSGCSMEDARKTAQLTIYRLLKQDGYAGSDAEAKAFMEAQGDEWIKDYLRTRSVDDLYSPENAGPLGLMLDKASVTLSQSPLVDGFVVPDNPLECLKQGEYHRVPIMIGNTSEEVKLLIPFLMCDPLNLWTAMSRFDPDHPDFDLRSVVIPALWPLVGVHNNVAESGQTVFQSYGVDFTAGILASHQKDVYVYRFAWDEEPKPFDFLIGAGHAMDLPFVFGNFPVSPDSWTRFAWSRANQAGREKLSEGMMAYHARFARTGNPNSGEGDLPEWKPWSPAAGHPQRMVFDSPAFSLSSQGSEPIELPCPQCSLKDILGVITSSYK